mgnify:CR=1 FL=1
MRKLLMLIAVVLPGLFGGTVYARPSEQAWHLRTDTVTSLAAQELLRRLPPFVYNDTAPAQPMSLLIYSESVYEPSPLRIDTAWNWERQRPPLFPDELTNPRWLAEARTRWNTACLLRQRLMTGPAHQVDYFAWQLPDPPQLQPITEAPVLPAMDAIPDALPSLDKTPEEVIRPRHWLHIVGLGLQFSQAYVSPNWYQGGDNSLTILANLGWNVKLNQVYHPNLLVESNLSYKLGLYSTPHDEKHKYAISEDLLQYNLTTGLKAFRHWYYSFSLLFKTQMLNNYAPNSTDRKASFLAPGELNLGLGMTYSYENPKKTLTFTAALSPLSYNLKMCTNSRLNPVAFGIEEGKRSVSQYGSSAELTCRWKITYNIEYFSRMFIFTNYEYVQGDWENTINFNINKFLTTRIFAHLRYQSDAERIAETRWHKWQLKEILSIGFAYKFSRV